MRNSRQRGSSLVELLVSLCLLIPIALYAVDACAVITATSSIQFLCRNVARSAANGEPAQLSRVHSNQQISESSAPFRRAKATIALTGLSKALTSNCSISLVETVQAPLPCLPFGGEVNGQVQARIVADVIPPLRLPGVAESVQVSAEDTFPYTWTMPTQTQR